MCECLCVYVFSPPQDADLESWDLWKQRSGFRYKRDRVQLNRFQACIDRAEKELPFWSMDSFEREYVALELDMLKSQKLRHRIVAKGRDVDPGEDAAGGDRPTTSTRRMTWEDKSLKTICDSAVCISVALLDDVD